MTARRAILLSMLLALPLAGAFAGWAAGPMLARAHYIVQLAEQLWVEQSQGATTPSLQTEAYRATGGVPPEMIYTRAREIRATFRRGGAALGIWIGLVAALTLIGIARERRRAEYEADAADCLACGRCFLSCPVEQERRGLITREDLAALESEPLSGTKAP